MMTTGKEGRKKKRRKEGRKEMWRKEKGEYKKKF